MNIQDKYTSPQIAELKCQFIKNSTSCAVDAELNCNIEAFPMFEGMTFDEAAQILGGWDKVHAMLDAARQCF